MKSTVATGTRIVGQISCEGDLIVEGHIEGGPLRVSGCLTVSASATVQCADAEVGEALVIGLFQGTLRARDAVRIHHSGRVTGDILAPRVVFVSSATDRPAEKPAAARPATPVPAAPRAPTPTPARPAPPAPAPAAPPAAAPQAALPQASAPPAAAPRAPAAAVAPQAPAAAAAPQASAPPAPQAAAPPAPVAAPPAPQASAPVAVKPAAPPVPATPRAIPTLPSIGQRAMERKG